MRILPRRPSTKVAEYTTRGRATWWWWSLKDYDNDDECILKNQSFAVSVDFETSIWTPPEVTDWYDDKEGNLFFSHWISLACPTTSTYMGQIIDERSSRVFIWSAGLSSTKVKMRKNSGFHAPCLNRRAGLGHIRTRIHLIHLFI